MTNILLDIGKRLHAFRENNNLSPEDMADRLEVSRAAVYRLERGDIRKIETLSSIASMFGITLGSLLGVGAEHYAEADKFFKHMLALEEEAEQIVAFFPPFSYLLTSAEYPEYLRSTLMEGVQEKGEAREAAIAAIDRVLAVLAERKKVQEKRRFSIINFISALEIERWLKLGGVGRFDLPESEVARHRRAARREVESLISMMRSEPMGVQLALVSEIVPNSNFQLFRSASGVALSTSPFRLGGELPNIRHGVAILTHAAEPVQLYEKLADSLWSTARKGNDAVEYLLEILERSGI